MKNTFKTFSTLWRLQKQKKLLFIGISFSLIATMLGLAIPLIIARLIDGMEGGGDLTKWIIYAVVLAVIQIIFVAVSQLSLSVFGAKVFKLFQHTLTDRLINSDSSTIKEKTVNEWSSHLTSDTFSAREMLSEEIPEIIQSLIQVIMLVIAILILDWYLLIPILLIGSIILIIMVNIGSKLDGLATIGKKLVASLNSTISETLTSIKTVKSYQIEKQRVSINHKILDDIYENHIKSSLWTVLSVPVVNGLLIIAGIILIIIGMIQISIEYITVGKFIAVILYILQVIPKGIGLTASIAYMKELNGELAIVMKILTFKQDKSTINKKHQQNNQY